MPDDLMELSKDQVTFFDRVYPSISRRLHDLESDQKNKHYQMTELKSQLKVMELTVDQYKKKIQKIEQLLIQRGLKSWIKSVFE